MVFAPTDVVGYSTQEIAGGKLNCAAFQFGSLDTGNASLSDLSVSGLTAGIYDTMETDAPCIMIFDGVAGYDNYYYIEDADDGTERYDLKGWANGSGELVADVDLPGTGFWLRVPEATCTTGAMTEAGQVLDAKTATIEIASGLTLAGNPYPTALDLSKVVTTGLTAGIYDTMETDAPCIMIFDGVAGYDNYYYIEDADDGTERYDLKGWANGSGELVDVVAPAGAGFWARSATAGTLTFSL